MMIVWILSVTRLISRGDFAPGKRLAVSRMRLMTIMRNILHSLGSLLLLLVLGVIALPSFVCAQQQQQQADSQQTAPPQDPILQLNLTPEQRQKIRAIREQSKDERAAVNHRLREAQIAFEQALDSDTPDETVIE